MIKIDTAQEGQGSPLVEFLTKQFYASLQVFQDLVIALSHSTALRHIALIHDSSHDACTERGTIIMSVRIAEELGQIEESHTTNRQSLSLVVFLLCLQILICSSDIVDVCQNHITVLDNAIWS